MESFDPASLTLESIGDAEKILHQSDHFKRTPLIKHCERSSPRIHSLGCKFHIKLESTQVTGSFKIRGLIPLMNELKKDPRCASNVILN